MYNLIHLAIEVVDDEVDEVVVLFVAILSKNDQNNATADQCVLLSVPLSLRFVADLDVILLFIMHLLLNQKNQ